jgi:hypothetical protein
MRIILTFIFSFLSSILIAQNGAFIPTKSYRAHKINTKLIIDGLAKEEVWSQAEWTDNFIDIEGSEKPRPYYQTKVKMLWDTEYLYFYAELEEPAIWANLTERDAVIFYDNDFEIFIDPDGDTHNYHELEINAFNTVWDLLLTRAYRDAGHALNNWNLKGLKTAISLDGTINNPSDKDIGWSVEIAIPWTALSEGTKSKTPPLEGDMWRINFSRVQWQTEVIDGKYVKKKDAVTGNRLAEHNWVWSPQRVIAMHEPEFWGRVYFTNDSSIVNDVVESDYIDDTEQARQMIYNIHRAQIQYRNVNKRYTSRKKFIINYTKTKRLKSFKWKLSANGQTYWASLKEHNSDNTYWNIDHTGKIWKEIRK